MRLKYRTVLSYNIEFSSRLFANRDISRHQGRQLRLTERPLIEARCYIRIEKILGRLMVINIFVAINLPLSRHDKLYFARGSSFNVPRLKLPAVNTCYE